MTDTQQAGHAEERAALDALDARSFLSRSFGYLRLMGPGYLQSAMTLGGGTAFASIFAGAAFGYRLLWVAPLAMALGIIVLAAVAHQTLSTGERPFDAMRRHAGAFFAYGWALSALGSSVIWQFAQYALASAMLAELARSAGWTVPKWATGVIALAWCVTVAMLYGRGHRLVVMYERILKLMVWGIVACFAWVVIKAGVPEPGALARGFVPGIPDENQGVRGLTLIVSGLAAAVGVNMLFVYPYSLRQRGWGRAHRRLARFDLVFGMFVPYSIAASLMVIAAASVFHYGDPSLFTGRKIAPVEAAAILGEADRLGPVAGLWVFGLGITAMALSSITMQMLSSGFALCEMFGWEARGVRYRIGMLIPAVGVLGSVFWSDISLWIAVPTNVVCGFLLPLSYVGFIILQRSRSYLGDDRPRGALGATWIVGMGVSTAVLVVFLAWFLWTSLPGWLDQVRGP